MPLSTSLKFSVLSICCPSHSIPKGSNGRSFLLKRKDFNIWSKEINFHRTSRNGQFTVNSAAGDKGYSVGYDVPFPNDYSELLQQAKEATELALKDNRQLMEIEFPTAGLESVPGDGEGGIEMTESMRLIREYCDLFVTPEKVTRTRIFFPEANEVQFARNSVFGGASYKLDYLTKPSFFEDFGFVEKVKMSDRVKPEDEVFVVGYPYFNVNEMLVVEELYKEAVATTSRKLIIFNGELDRIRSGCILECNDVDFKCAFHFSQCFFYLFHLAAENGLI
ncbi:OLC1v1031044C1 [Oldenlandia corymbosa var. corymbosa]|uniref:OLC1v1031044C1 n=1 Tax=Oldenlandia corymbosa var. corymbosa TaxID=529605 RepID=A0AAV1CHJ3_OLDCO|nr:OLC1v1031044C1 [Oldenlandia corymbosa var. corymbosa]